MQTKFIREGLLGLFVLAALGILGGSVLWLRGNRFGKMGFRFTVQFLDGSGLITGAPVQYRGVPIGKVESLAAKPNGVEVTIAVNDPQLIIPKDAQIIPVQSGILSSTSIEITPQGQFTEDPTLDPVAEECDKERIICNGSIVVGGKGTSFSALLQETTALLRKINDEKILENLGSTLKSTDRAARSIETLTGQASGVIAKVEAPLQKFEETAEAFKETASSITKAAQEVGEAAKGVDALFLENKDRIAQTLESISNTAKETQKFIARARPLVEDGKFVSNLQKLSENAAETAANFRKLSETANDPATLATLRETLEAARATFANTQKITTDLNELTGDPRFRSDLRRLVNGLSGLVSSGNTLVTPGTPVAQKPVPKTAP